MIRKVMSTAFAFLLIGLVSVSNTRADEWNKATKMTFSGPVDVAGHVLAAGTYWFILADTADRHVVQIFTSGKHRKIIATVLTIPDYRLKAKDKTYVSFRETPAGSPEVVRAWFYPGRTIGDEFVYPKHRAKALAKAANVPVPAAAVETADVETLKTVEIVAVTPEQEEVPVEAVILTKETATVAELPHTASRLPLIALFGLGSMAAAFGLMVFGTRKSEA